MDDDAEATLVIDWNRVAADVNYRETIVLAAEAQAIVDKERAAEVLTEPRCSLLSKALNRASRFASASLSVS